MTTRIYVGNLPASATAAEVRVLFGAFGTVEWVNLVTDAVTGRPRGFAYVGISSGADAAIRMLHGLEMAGRNLRVRRALPLCQGGVSRLRAPRRMRTGETASSPALPRGPRCADRGRGSRP